MGFVESIHGVVLYENGAGDDEKARLATAERGLPCLLLLLLLLLLVVVVVLALVLLLFPSSS